MRRRFEQQLSLGIIPISEVEIRIKSRDEMPPLLVALQTIFVTEDLNEAVFAILEDTICKNKKATGRQGMDLWHILVLSLVRHACNTNWDKLHYFSNNDMTMRNIMGLHNNEFGEGFYEFEYQTILDNVSLLDTQTIEKINTIVVNYGVTLFKKKVDEALQLKTDSFVVETNIHFPTDLNLLNDSVRKGLERIQKLIGLEKIESDGWRKLKSIKREFKSLLRSTSWAVFKGKKEDYKIMYKEKDASQIIPLLERLKDNYPNQIIDSLSTDKGFYSKTNFESCVTAGIKKTVMPKKGKCNKEEYAREHEHGFIKLRNKHSAVESNINMLEHHGLNRCMDKGKFHFERYVSLSVLAYNLHVIGNELVKRRKIKQEKEKLKFYKQVA